MRFRRKAASRGQALVELAMVAPVMLLLLGGAVDLGRVFYSQITVVDAAREGVLWATQHPNSWMQGCDSGSPISASNENQVVCHARNEADGGFVRIAAGDVTCSSTAPPTITPCALDSPDEGDTVWVTVTGHFSTIIGGIEFDLVTTAVGRIEQLPPAGAQAGQTISFSTLGDTALGSGSITVSATATSGLTVTFSSTTPAVCGSGGTNGATITIAAVGTCTVLAEQAGDAYWSPAPPVSQTFEITPPPTPPPGGQLITFDPLPDRQLGTGSVTVAATASSGLPVSFTTTTPSVCGSSGTDGSTISLIQQGTCTVQADQPGDATYTAAPAVMQTFTITPPPPPPCVAPTVSFTATPTIGTDYKNAAKPGTLFAFNANATTLDPSCNPVWSWNFGNSAGTSSTPWQTSYTYPDPGPPPSRMVTVTLMVTVDGNLSGSTTRVITVNPS